MKVSQMKYTRIDIDEADKKLETLIARFSQAQNGQEQLALDEEINNYLNDISTTINLANIRYTQNTKDEFYSAENDYYDSALPKLSVRLRELSKAYVESPFREELKSRIPEVSFVNKKLQMESINSLIVEELQKENNLTTEYTKLMSGTQVNFEGKQYTLSQMTQFSKNSDRKVRRAACIATGKALKKIAKKIDNLYDQLVNVRTEIAKKLGFKTFSEVGYRRMCRNCYDQNDIARFRANIKKYIVPLVTELKHTIASHKGIKKFMLYDNEVYSEQEPKPIGTVEEIFDAGKKMYSELSSDTACLFDLMSESEAFDVLSRDGKWGGGYCTDLANYKLPFILANFNGSMADIDVLTHEFGHAFAAYEAFKIPFESAKGDITMETCECHSMSMEFFAYKWMDLFFGDKAEAYKFSHLAGCLSFLPYGTIVDFFQQTAYDYYPLTASDRNEFWKQAEQEFMPYMTSKGLPFYRTGRRWQQKAHIFEQPFYYIDYCLAQLTAFQFFALMQKDYDGAFAKYVQFVKLGGTKNYLEILKEVGLKSPFEEDTFIEIADCLKKALNLSGV